LGTDVLDYVLANAERLGAVNGREFVPGFLAQHIRRFGRLGDDPRVPPFLDRRGRLRWLRKRVTRSLRRLIGRA
jgi:hypothetical protein